MSPVTGPAAPRAWFNAIPKLAIAALIAWFCVIGAREVFEGVDAGVLNNRKGPDVLASEQPIVFWALIVFYSTAVVVGAGLALLLASIGVRGVGQDPGAGPR